MNDEIPARLFDKIDAALLGVAEALPRLPEWHEAVRKLGPATPDQTRLAVYQAVRDDGSPTKEPVSGDSRPPTYRSFISNRTKPLGGARVADRTVV
ncbi:MAG TPA: hypothetical protein VFW94_00600 [Candidatus Acidoferrales bacterium]|nr:hypothetical protein [Candidatus Acidoferrales bacterium]